MSIARLAFAMNAPALRSAAAVPPWTPLDLGAALKAWYNADDHGTANMTDDGAGLISSWKDRVSSLNNTGATTARPTWGAASFNSAYAGLTFNGTSNSLANVAYSSVLPTTTPGEVWVVANQAVLGSDATARYVMVYGTWSSNVRRLYRAPVTSVNRLNSYVQGIVLTDTVVDLSGNHIIGMSYEAAVMTARLNGQATTPASSAATPALTTGITRFAIGSANDTVAAGFWSGIIRHLIFTTGPLSLANRQKIEGWAAWDSGLVGNLPVGHPYKSVRP